MTTWINGHGRPLAAAPDYDHHPCPVPGCPTVVSDGQVACREHWLAVDHAQRNLLAAAFRQRVTRPDLYEQACALARHLVLTAAENCRTAGAA